ncbi:hypothetical protein [Alkalibacillus aidingensis]|uniref:hypothetical protein n=1 Tax=Alkalibacillus aidingensis TaxID=2747607 RepID=UPI001661177F|nr:hypothetical protein [Alkalibacillus aidingensis]
MPGKEQIKQDLELCAKAMNGVLETLIEVEEDLHEYSVVLERDDNDLMILMAEVEESRENFLDLLARFEVISEMKGG